MGTQGVTQIGVTDVSKVQSSQGHAYVCINEDCSLSLLQHAGAHLCGAQKQQYRM